MNYSLPHTLTLRLLALAAFAGAAGIQGASTPSDLMHSEFIYQPGPVPQVHASSLAETRDGELVAAWFGGTAESNPDVCIYVSRRENGRWTDPQKVADGVVRGGVRFATWNPVLFQPRSGPLQLFYKVGPSPENLWGMVMHSDDGGKTWSEPRRLPSGILGPIKNKPVELTDGTWVSGSSTEDPVRGWQVHVERSTDQGRTWSLIGPLNTSEIFNAIQPSLLVHADGRLQLLCRSKEMVLTTAWSSDGGLTWSPMISSGLHNPNSGSDAVTLADGTHLLVYNHRVPAASVQANPKFMALGGAQPGVGDASEDWGVRWPLNLSLSRDGIHWEMVLTLEEQPRRHGYAYPAVIRTRDGLVHIAYTWDRERIKHVVLDPARLPPAPAPSSPITNFPIWNGNNPVVWPDARRPPVESVFLWEPEGDWMYAHHAAITFFSGRFFATWSSGRELEDRPGQRVMIASSTDFRHWTTPRVLVDSATDESGQERVLTAAGLHDHDGILMAYFGNYGPNKEGTHLQAVASLDGETWSEPIDTGVPLMPNYGPQRLASGRLIISGNIAFPFSDDPSGLVGWQMTGIYPQAMAAYIKDDPVAYRQVSRAQGWAAALCEGSFYQTDDGVLHMLLRNTGRPARNHLWVTESRDEGVTWSQPVETGFSDTSAKFHFGRLPDGRFYYVGNPVGRGRLPLVLSLSHDGVRWDRHFVLGEQPYATRSDRQRGETPTRGSYGYPHTLIQDGYLYVIVSRQKEAIEVLRVSLAKLDP